MNILFVCTGNTCRSPMAEGYLNSLKLPNIRAFSCGLSVGEYSCVNKNSVEAMKDIGINISDHNPRPVTAEIIGSADKIICMSGAHAEALRPYCALEKLEVLEGGIFDPYGGSLETYIECRNEITAAIDRKFLPLCIVGWSPEYVEHIARLEKICFSAPWSEKAIIAAKNSGTDFFIAKKGGKFAGYVGVSAVLDEGYIANVAVQPELRRSGVGAALMRRLENYAEDKNLSFISLEVRQSNAAAISLYEAFGYKKEGARKNFYDNPKEDAVILTKGFR